MHLKFTRSKYFMDFIRKYPVFGFWVFFTLAQCTAWGLLGLLFYGSYEDFRKDIKAVLPGNETAFMIKSFIQVILIVGVFCFLIYWIIIDTWVIEDHFFFINYNLKMLGYAVIGYGVTLCALPLNFLFLKVMETLDASEKKGDDSGCLSAEKKAKIHKSLSAMFNTTFYFCALSLSMFVFWTALIVTGVNNLEVMKLYTSLSGSPFIPTDYVFLIGLVNSLILLIFFIPIYLQLKKRSPENEKEVGDIGKANFSVKALLSGLTSNLGTILITASPILSGFFQEILKLLLQ